jgi:hypothetical protein
MNACNYFPIIPRTASSGYDVTIFPVVLHVLQVRAYNTYMVRNHWICFDQDAVEQLNTPGHSVWERLALVPKVCAPQGKVKKKMFITINLPTQHKLLS